eukprot:375270-Pelagomonas_calceolata.AAC.9
MDIYQLFILFIRTQHWHSPLCGHPAVQASLGPHQALRDRTDLPHAAGRHAPLPVRTPTVYPHICRDQHLLIALCSAVEGTHKALYANQ